MKRPVMKKHRIPEFFVPGAAVGSSANDNAFAAGAEAARQALEGLAGSSPGLLLVFGSSRFDQQALLEGIVSVVPDIPMVGGTTAGEISLKGISPDAVVIMALGSEHLRFRTGIGTTLSRDEEAAVREMSGQMFSGSLPDDAQTLMVFPSGMDSNVLRTIDSLRDCFGERFEIIGGYPGGEGLFQETVQYHNGKVYTDAIAGVLICHDDDCCTGTGVCSGFESIGNSFCCTSSEGHILKEIDNQPSLDLFREIVGEERYSRLPEIFVEYPFGLIDESASTSDITYFQLRTGIMANTENKTIVLTAPIPKGSRVTLAAGTCQDLIAGAENAARDAVMCLGEDYEPQAAVMFSCIGRVKVLGRRLEDEVESVRNVIGKEVPLAGFYTFGEVGPINKKEPRLASAKYHNVSVVIWVLGTVRK